MTKRNKIIYIYDAVFFSINALHALQWKGNTGLKQEGVCCNIWKLFVSGAFKSYLDFRRYIIRSNGSRIKKLLYSCVSFRKRL